MVFSFFPAWTCAQRQPKSNIDCVANDATLETSKRYL